MENDPSSKFHLSCHKVPHPNAAPCHNNSNASRSRDAADQCDEENLGVEPDRVNCQAVLVDVPLLLKDVVKVPDLDAPVDGGSDDTVVSANHQRLDLHNPLQEEGGVTHPKKNKKQKTWKWATILLTKSPVFMSQQSSSCLLEDSIGIGGCGFT